MSPVGADADFINALVEVEDIGPAMVVIDTGPSGRTHPRTLRFPRRHTPHLFRVPTMSRCPGPTSSAAGRRAAPRTTPDRGHARRLRRGVRRPDALGARLRHRPPRSTASQRRPARRARRRPAALRRLRIKAYAARSMVYRTARLADAGENIVNEGIACKVFATEAVGEVVDTAIQLVGGKALTIGHPWRAVSPSAGAPDWRRARATSCA